MAVVGVLLLAIILAIVFASKGGDEPSPTPDPGPGPKPNPPAPIPNAGVNPYYVDNTTIGTTKYAVMGQLFFNNSKFNDTKM